MRQAVIEARGISKAFDIPSHRIDSLKERTLHPFARRSYRRLEALREVTFDVRRGEFFGIVGRNGSGKSTLLKILSSIYRADSGSIRMAGRPAPFIELGVGFNVELSARENVILNGVMMGLSQREARRKLDAVLEFAELEEFADLKLKNYSSGMLVRLAFSVMMEADADVLLIDEVLAVGDASFQQKCADAFHTMKAEGKTIVLVTHEMSTVEDYCHRAMLIADGNVQHVGDPGEVGRRYLRLNFERSEESGNQGEESADAEVRLLDAHVENAAGERATAIEHGEPIKLRIDLEATVDQEGLDIGFVIANADGVGVFQYGVGAGEYGAREVAAGQRVRIESTVENPLAPGRYFVHVGVNRAVAGGIALYVPRAMDFVVFGGPSDRGIVFLPHETTAAIETGEQDDEPS
jgi:ABC-2 type transport system ATP-binding protein